MPVDLVRSRAGKEKGFEIRFPTAAGVDQNEEWFDVRIDGVWQRMGMHEYGSIFKVPGLYEALVYDELDCRSPERVVALLKSVLEDWPTEPRGLRVLDLGAGNGVVAEHLRAIEVERIVGADLLAEAKRAADRDRPEVYDEYVVGDIGALKPEQDRVLTKSELNCLVSVAALGFGDIPPEAFAAAVNYVADGGWLAFTIKERFLRNEDDTGFSRLIRSLLSSEAIALEAQQRYCHRRSLAGDRLFYVAMVARKRRDVSAEDLESSGSVPVGATVTLPN